MLAPAMVTTAATGEPMLALSEVDSYYGKAQILFGLSLRVGVGEVVAVIGANGAGKSTCLNVIVGRVRPAAGTVTLAGQPIGRLAVAEIVRRGFTCVPQRRRIFATMTVRENLDVGGFVRRHRKAELKATLEEVFDLFPVLARKAGALGGHLSGGEQQMLAVARALVLNPKLLLLDEPLEGLAPIIVEELLAAIRRITREEGISAIIVEQHPQMILEISDTAVVLEQGAVSHSGSAAALLADPALIDRLVGVARKDAA